MGATRQLAEDLRQRSDADLAVLFTERADLLVPLPPDFSVLAARALSRWSLSHALTGLDLWCGEVAQALVSLPEPSSQRDVAAALGVAEDEVARALDRLRALALAWGEPAAVTIAPPLRDRLPAAPPRPAHPRPPAVPARPVPPTVAEGAAGAAAAAALRAVDGVLEAWGANPPAVLKAGGLGQRDLRRAAAALDLSEETTALVLEAALGAGLLASSAAPNPVWLPTPGYDGWLARPLAARWLALAGGWLDSPRAPGRAGSRDERGKVLAALGPDLVDGREPAQRRLVLGALAALPEHEAGDAAALSEHAAWHCPLTFDPSLAADTLTAAELLGLTGRGALTAAGRALLAGAAGAAAAAIGPHLPTPGTTVLLQADLTAVAPGPLEPDLARELRLLAEVESTGGATVYRFSEASLRRAFDAGRTAGEVAALLAARSTTPVPQALTYLVQDVARRHGRIRVGSAQAFLRCDDETLLAEVLASRRTAGLRLRRLAPTVLAAQAPVKGVLETLRSAGFAPAAESPEGAVVLERAAQRRTPGAPAADRQPWPPAPSAAAASAAVRGVRAGERAARARPAGPGSQGPPAVAPAETLQLLRRAAREGRWVWIGYLNAAGVASSRIIEPAFVDGGYVTAFDHRRGERRTFAAHRITGAALVSEDEA